MNDKQRMAVMCAYLDLIGALQAIVQGDPYVHDWKRHRQSIVDLQEAFPDMLEPVKID